LKSAAGWRRFFVDRQNLLTRPTGCGEFSRGAQLPATRLLARQLGVTRMLVVNAYEQLQAVGPGIK
jgi:DNA-binding transcriptional MocR family regulator